MSDRNNYLNLRRRVYERFNEAIKKEGFLSLESIVRSQFKFPSTTVIDTKKVLMVLKLEHKRDTFTDSQLAALNKNRKRRWRK